LNKAVTFFSKIHIHPLLWLVIGISVATGYFFDLIMVLCIIAIHEMGHLFTALFFSWRIRKVSLLPFGGVAEMDEHGNRPLHEELLVVIAGPIQHVWMMGLAALLYSFHIVPKVFYDDFLMYNWMIVCFNLLPIWPLDGGKLILLILSRVKTFLSAMQWTVVSSFFLLVCLHAMVLIWAPFQLHLWIVLSFLYFSLWQEWKQRHYVMMRFLLERYYGNRRGIHQLKPITVSSDTALSTVLMQFQRGVKHPIIVMENGEEKGKLDENEVLHAYFSEKQTTVKIGDLLYYY
jgi:stage IV sporulation protein FB